MNSGSGDVTIVDPAHATVVATVTVGGSLELAVADGHGRMFVNVEDRNEVVVLNTRSQKIERRFPLPGCEGPTGDRLRSDDARHRFGLRRWCGGRLKRQNCRAADHRQRRRWRCFRPRPARCAGAGRARWKSDGDPALTPPLPVVTRITTAMGARTIAVDPSTGRAFLPSATMAAPVGNERPKPLPGTFRVLVVEP